MAIVKLSDGFNPQRYAAAYFFGTSAEFWRNLQTLRASACPAEGMEINRDLRQ
jgi:hypothetical protein